MKRFFTYLTLLAAMLMLGVVPAHSTVNIFGKSRTTSGNITDSGLTSGTVHYDASNRIITLTNAKVSLASGDFIQAYGSDYTTIQIIVVGNNTITLSGQNNFIYSEWNVQINKADDKAPGYLTINQTGTGRAIWMGNNRELACWRTHISVTAEGNTAVYGSGTTSLYTCATWFKAKGGSGYYSFDGFKSYDNTFNGKWPMSGPEHGTQTFSTTKKGFVNSSGVQQNETNIVPALVVGGWPINTRDNATVTSSTPDARLASGTITFNYDAGTLTLDGISMTAYNSTIYNNLIKGLKIVCTGTNTINNEWSGFYIYANTTFTGAGKLHINSSNNSGIRCYDNPDVTIQMANLHCFGKTYGIITGGTLSVKRLSGSSSDYFFRGEDANVQVGKLEMNDMLFYNPYTWYNDSKQQVYYKDATATKANNDPNDSYQSTNIYYADSFTKYDVYVGGTQLNNRNAQGFWNKYVKGGTITYSGGTLYLNNAKISGQTGTVDNSTNCAIYANVDGLKIDNTGTSNIESAASALCIGKNTTITGSGGSSYTLLFNSTSTAGVRAVSSANLTLDLTNGTKFYAKGEKYGYWGISSTTLTIKRASLSSKGGDYYFFGKNGNIYNTKLTMDKGADFYTLATWYNEASSAVYLRDAVAKSSDLSSNFTNIDASKDWTYYDLYIADTQLNDRNRYEVWNKYVNGSVKYDGSGTLTLTNANVNLGSELDVPVIKSSLSSLNIVLSGTSTFKKSSNAQNLLSLGNATIKGSGTLNLEATYCSRQLVANTTLAITDGATVIATGDFSGSTSGTGTLKVDGAILQCKKIKEYSAVTLGSGIGFAIPNGGYLVGSAVYVANAAYNYSNGVRIQPLTGYGISVAGLYVNSYNKDNIFADPMYKGGTSGTATFDPTARVLHLSGVNITATGTDGIATDSNQNTVVEFTGTNTISATGSTSCAIWNANDVGELTLQGNGSNPKFTATTTSSGVPGIYSTGNLRINGLEVNANGIQKNGSGERYLYVDDATVNLTGYGSGTIAKWSDVKLANNLIYSPDARYNSTNKRLENADGSLYTGAVSIKTGGYYNLFIAGNKVSTANANNITGTGISGSGYVKYDNATKTLTLNNIKIVDVPNEYPIWSGINDLKVVIEGNVSLEPSSGYSLCFGTPGRATITGSGTLNVTGGFNCYGDLIVDGATIKGNKSPFVAQPSNGQELIIVNSDIEFTYPGANGAMYNWDYVELDGCVFTYPAKAEYSSADGCIFVDNTAYTGGIHIEPATLYGITVAGVPIHSKNVDNIAGATGANGKMTITRSGGNTNVNLNNFWLHGHDSDNRAMLVFTDDAGDVTINLEGETNITSTDAANECMLWFDNSDNHSHKITGSGKITCNAVWGIQGNDSHSTLYIDGTTINTGMICGFFGVGLNNSNVTLFGDGSHPTVDDVLNMSMNGCGITEPAGAAYVQTQQSICVSGSPVTSAITIAPMEKFGVTIAGVPVTDLNADDVLGDGKVKWSSTAKRLTLSDAQINGGSETAILIDGNELTDVEINLVGNNHINGNVGIEVAGAANNVTICSSNGTGYVDIDATHYGIDGHAQLTIRNAGVNVSGNDGGIHGGQVNIEQGAIVKAQGSTKAMPDYLLVKLYENMVVADGSLDGPMVAFGEDYGFSIGGARVTSYLIASTGLSIYNPASKTITISNVTADTYIENEKCDGLTLLVSGANSFNAGDNIALSTQRPMTIDGTGTFTINSNVAAINATADITIKGGVAVTINAGTNAYDGNNVSTLHVDNCVVRATAAGQVFKDLAGLDLIGVNLSEPANAVFEGGTVKVDGTAVSGETVVIGDVKSFGIDVAGIDVTTVNAGGIEGSDITGSVTYDDGTKTLTLNNAEIDGPIALAESFSDILNIQIIGDNKVTCTDTKAFYTKNGGFRFYSDGTGTLAITASGLTSSAVEAKLKIMFDNCLVVADGGQRGLSGVTQDCDVIVDNAAVRVRGEQSCIAGMHSIQLLNGVAANPTEDGKAIKVNDFGTKVEYASSGDVVRNTWIDLSEPYNMWIGAMMLTRATVYKESTDLATGVRYNRTTRTLNIENATLDGIWNGSGQPMNVVVAGTCTVNASKHGSGSKQPAVYAGADITFTANNTESALTLDGGSLSPAVLGEGVATVTFNNHLTTQAKGMRGIYSEDKQLTLVVENATLMVQGTTQSIAGLKALTMTGCGITVPASAVFNPATGAVELNGSAVVGQTVVIDPSGDGIDGITVDDADVKDIYAVDGKKLGRTQTGVNIVRKTDGSVVKVVRK